MLETLKELRISNGLTQADVAQKLDVTVMAVSRWELGKANPLNKYKERMAALYGVERAVIDSYFPPRPSRPRPFVKRSN